MISKTSFNALTSAALVTALLFGCSQGNNNEATNNDVTPPKLTAKWPTVSLPIAYNPEVEQQIQEMVSAMSLEQKIGQMMQPSIDHVTPEDVTQYYLGSVLNGGGMYPNKDRHAKAEDWMTLADAYWDASLNMPEGVPAIPLIWGTDAVHGHNNVVGATLFPHNSALGAANNPALVKRIGQAVALEVVATGIDWNFAPTTAVAKNLRWGRTYESFSESPGIVAELSAAMVLGLQGEPNTTNFLAYNHVIATAKHFIGDGATTRGDDQGKTELTEQELINQHLTGYLSTLSSGAQTVMASYSSWQGIPMHAHNYLLTDVLKEHLGFDGFVISDWNAIGHVEGCTRDNCATAINAGVDMLMVPAKPDWPNMITNTIAQVKSGEIAMSRIDDAVTRILRVKVRAGLFKGLRPSSRSAYTHGEYLSTGSHRGLAREAVRESLVLLKNNNNLLPLSANKHLLIAGNAANDVAMQSGGWTISWQGDDTSPEDFPAATSIYKGMLYTTRSAGGKVTLSETGDYTERPDAAIVVFGEEPFAEMRGDLENLKTFDYNRQYSEALSILKKLQADGIPTVSVFISGRPRLVTKELNASDAFVMAWLPGSEGQGIADVLLEGADPAHPFKGRLPFAWPSEPCPNTDGSLNNPLFPFSFGLTYQSQQQTPAFDENYTPFTHGCDLPETLDDITTYTVNNDDWKLHLELKSLEKVAVTDSTTWQGLTASIVRSEARTFEQIDLTWKDAPRNNAVLQDGLVHSMVPNLVAGHALTFDLNIAQAADQKVWLKMECGHLCSQQIDVTQALKTLPKNTWKTVYVPLECVANHRTDLAKINSIFRIDSSGNFNVSLKNIAVGPVSGENALNLCQ